MKILLGCEESQAVCIAFREAGHEAYSCDLLPCSGGHPEWHIKEDVFRVLSGGYWDTQLGVRIYAQQWDKIICFPPCTDLTLSGAKHFEKKRNNGTQEASIRFFFELWKKSDCLENPKGIMNGGEYIKKWFPELFKEMKAAGFPFKPDQIVNPFDFGDAAQKPTCLWLRGLPPLRATNMGDAPLFGSQLDKGEFHTTSGGNKLPKWYNLPPSEDRAKIRSKTFEGIAKAMASQWGRISKAA